MASRQPIRGSLYGRRAYSHSCWPANVLQVGRGFAKVPADPLRSAQEGTHHPLTGLQRSSCWERDHRDSYQLTEVLQVVEGMADAPWAAEVVQRRGRNHWGSYSLLRSFRCSGGAASAPIGRWGRLGETWSPRERWLRLPSGWGLSGTRPPMYVSSLAYSGFLSRVVVTDEVYFIWVSYHISSLWHKTSYPYLLNPYFTLWPDLTNKMEQEGVSHGHFWTENSRVNKMLTIFCYFFHIISNVLERSYISLSYRV